MKKHLLATAVACGFSIAAVLWIPVRAPEHQSAASSQAGGIARAAAGRGRVLLRLAR